MLSLESMSEIYPMVRGNAPNLEDVLLSYASQFSYSAKRSGSRITVFITVTDPQTEEPFEVEAEVVLVEKALTYTNHHYLKLLSLNSDDVPNQWAWFAAALCTTHRYGVLVPMEPMEFIEPGFSDRTKGALHAECVLGDA